MAGRKTRSLEALQKKKSDLEKQEQEIKRQIFEEIKQCLDSRNAFDIDFDIIIGGIIDLIETAKSDEKKAEVWKQAGQKFCGKTKRKKSSKSATKSSPATKEVEKNNRQPK